MRFGFCKCQADPQFSSVSSTQLRIKHGVLAFLGGSVLTPSPWPQDSGRDSSVGVNVPSECVGPAYVSSNPKHVPAFRCWEPQVNRKDHASAFRGVGMNLYSKKGKAGTVLT